MANSIGFLQISYLVAGILSVLYFGCDPVDLKVFWMDKAHIHLTNVYLWLYIGSQCLLPVLLLFKPQLKIKYFISHFIAFMIAIISLALAVSFAHESGSGELHTPFAIGLAHSIAKAVSYVTFYFIIASVAFDNIKLYRQKI